MLRPPALARHSKRTSDKLEPKVVHEFNRPGRAVLSLAHLPPILKLEGVLCARGPVRRTNCSFARSRLG